ncbi:putative Fe-S cluster assembly protein SufT [Saccharospirillum sp. MSK14-1]|uniref:putative Fe-S cluster assembly protein SufT n=1 Tax=Saccharospirillum sp. MSK14-1 TaxID=1897632 RepID=UPI000D39AAF0
METSLKISTAARDFLNQLLARQKVEGMAARLFVSDPGTPRAETCLAYCRPGEEQPTDTRLEVGEGLVLFLEKASLPYLKDLEMGVQDDERGQRLTIKAPNAKTPGSAGDTRILLRDCAARQVPSGAATTLPEGAEVRITQSLGGSYTLIYGGNMVRVDGSDADALGLEPNGLSFDAPADGRISEDQVWQALATVYDPEIPVDIVNLGLVYKLDIDQEKHSVAVEMTLTAPGCGMGDVLVGDVKFRLAQVPHVQQTDVELVFDPPWQQHMMSEEARLETGLFF